MGVFLQQALGLQRVGHFRNQVPPHAAQVRQCREHPDGRRAKRDDAEHFHGIARRAPGEKVIRQRFVGLVNALRASHLLDQKPERRVHEVLVQLAAANTFGKGDLSDFTRDAGSDPQRGSDQSLRK